jgi:hypothetical protein
LKTCYTCKLNKNLQEFPKHNQKKDGLDPNCKQCRRNRANAAYPKHADKIKEKSLEYYKNNKKYINKRNHNYQKNKWQTEPIFLLMRRLRNRLYYALKNTNWKKDTNFSNYIGCDRNTLVKYIESKFKDGMNWQNRNEWHIDHIKPLSLAKSEEELYKLCHYTNLQPLWAKDNLSKGNKILK